MPAPGNYITALPPAQIEEFYSKVSKGGLGDPKKLAAIRALFGKSDAVSCDGQGRVGIGASLLEHAGIQKESEVVMVGTLTRFEIWNAKYYATSISDDDMNQALRDLGI